MRNINIELLSEPELFAYAWRKKGFRKLSLLMAALTAVAAVVIVQRGPALNLSAVIEWFILMACGEVMAVGMVLYIQKALHRNAAIKTMIQLGADAALYGYVGESNAHEFDMSFLIYIKALELGRGRPWMIPWPKP